MLVLTHHSSYVHVHFVIDLSREIAIIDCVATVAQATVLQSISLAEYVKNERDETGESVSVLHNYLFGLKVDEMLRKMNIKNEKFMK